ncbi:MAG: PIN domain-containing protein [Pseudoruegeria sp.]
MRLIVDACVLYPTVLREVVLGVAKSGVFTPLWSDRILSEWTHAAARLGPDQAVFSTSEAAILRTQFPNAVVVADDVLESQLYLPDENDCHVLAAAITGQADGVLTLNLKDFPKRILADYGLSPVGPDAFFYQLAMATPELLRPVTDKVHADAETLSGHTISARSLYKKARLPRMAKIFYGA